MRDTRLIAFINKVGKFASALNGTELARIFDLNRPDAASLGEAAAAAAPGQLAELASAWLRKEPLGTFAEPAALFLAVLAVRDDPVAAFQCQQAFVVALQRAFAQLPRWALPLLYVANRQLRDAAVAADAAGGDTGKPNAALEEAARTLNRSFTLCVTDREPLAESRKWGVYAMINLLMPTYGRLGTRGLCRSLTRALTVGEMPEFGAVAAAHRVAFRFHSGVDALWGERFAEAEAHFAYALEHCLSSQLHNRALLVAYLVPLRLALSGRMPAAAFFQGKTSLGEATAPLWRVYGPLLAAVCSGNVAAFDDALSEHEPLLFARGLYLLVDACRWQCLRVCLRRLWLVLNQQSRLSLVQCRAALAAVSREPPTIASTECVLANLIDRGLVRGYLSHELGYLVLSQRDPFPAGAASLVA